MSFLDSMVGQELRDFINSGTLGDIFKFTVAKFSFGDHPKDEMPRMSHLTTQEKEGFQQIEIYRNYVKKYKPKNASSLIVLYDNLLKYPVSVEGRGRKDARAALTGISEPERRGLLEGFMNRPQNVEVITQK